MEVNVTKAPDSRLITDGYDPHNTDAIKRWLTAWPRFHVHFTRISVSWQERVEGWFSKAAERCIHRGTHRSTPFLDQAIRQLIDLNTEDLRPFVLTEAADDILASLERIGQRSPPQDTRPARCCRRFPISNVQPKDAQLMLPTDPGIRIAIAQINMHWTIEENLDAIRKAMHRAHAEGARLCAFSELAVTGAHRRIVEFAKPELVEPAVDEIKRLSARLRMGTALGAPTFDRADLRYITHHLIDEHGEVSAAVPKRGLTDPEATFFARGSSRPSGVIQGLRSTAVICREVSDLDQVAQDIPKDSVDLIFVPGSLRQDPDKPKSDPPPYVYDIQALAVATGAYMVQTNWPNTLNRPEEGIDAGQSCLVSPQGALLFRLPKEASGIGVFNLGETSFAWHPQ